MPKHLMIAIDWYGPYRTLEAAHFSAKEEYDGGFYMCIGKIDSKHSKRLHYIGISKNLHKRLVDTHHKISSVTHSAEFWLGEVGTAEPSGRRMKVTPKTLDYAEWLHAHFLHLPLNDRKTKRPPDRSVTVLNRWWWCKDGYPPHKRPHKDWPDLIDYPTLNLPTPLIWFDEKQRRIDPST